MAVKPVYRQDTRSNVPLSPCDTITINDLKFYLT